MILRNFVILSFCAIFLACSNDEKIKSDNTQNQNPDNTQNQNPGNIVMYIGKYPERLLFNSAPKYNISDYGAYYYITKKNNLKGVLTTWLVDYNLHSKKKDTYYQIISNNNEGLIKLNGYYETTDSKGNWIYGDIPDYNVDFTNKGVIKSTENLLHVFYY
jgi:hypothetical protein